MGGQRCSPWWEVGMWEGVPGLGVSPCLPLDSHVAFRSPLASVSLSVLICRMETTSLS